MFSCLLGMSIWNLIHFKLYPSQIELFIINFPPQRKKNDSFQHCCFKGKHARNPSHPQRPAVFMCHVQLIHHQVLLSSLLVSLKPTTSVCIANTLVQAAIILLEDCKCLLKSFTLLLKSGLHIVHYATAGMIFYEMYLPIPVLCLNRSMISDSS